jgi:hypothetical protein
VFLTALPILGAIARPTPQQRVLVFSYRPSPLYSWLYGSLASLQRMVQPLCLRSFNEDMPCVCFTYGPALQGTLFVMAATLSPATAPWRLGAEMVVEGWVVCPRSRRYNAVSISVVGAGDVTFSNIATRSRRQNYAIRRE